MGSLIKVGMADLKVCRFPDQLTTLGLGSCVGIVIYDPITKVGGLAHAMLPDSKLISNNQNVAKFVDTGFEKLIKEMMRMGASKSRFKAKLAGGAQMFNFSSNNELMKIGQRNVIAAKEALRQHGIPLLAEETGKNYGRTIILDTANGDLTVKSIGKGIKTI